MCVYTLYLVQLPWVVYFWPDAYIGNLIVSAINPNLKLNVSFPPLHYKYIVTDIVRYK